MGTWSDDPTGNDEAQEWLANSIEYPLLEAIKTTLEHFLQDASDDVSKNEVQVAVALLLDLGSEPPGFRYVRFNIDHIAREQGLWDKAIQAIKTLQSDAKWLQGWTDPEKKAGVLRELLAALEISKSE